MALIPATEDNSVKVQSILIRDRAGDVIQPAPDELGIQVIGGIAYLVDRFGTLTPIGSSSSAGITALTGDVLAGPGFGTVAATIAPHVVTFAKMQTIIASSILGNPTGAPGDIQEMSAATTKTLLGLAAIATSGSASDLTSGTVADARLGNTAVTPGSYTNTALTVDAHGRITAAANGTAPPSELAYYLVTRATNAPTNAINLGAMANGVLQQTVATSIATVAPLTMVTGQMPYGAATGVLAQETNGPFYDAASTKWMGLGTASPNLSSYAAGSRGMTFVSSGSDGGALEFKLGVPDGASAHVIGNQDYWNGTQRVFVQQVDNITSLTNARLRWFINASAVQVIDVRSSQFQILVPAIFSAAVTHVAGSYTFTQASQQGLYKTGGKLQVGPLSAHVLELMSDSIVVATVDATAGAGTGRLTLANGATGAAVSTAGTGAFMYNATTSTLQFSNNGGAWADIGGGGSGITGTVGAGQVVFGTGLSTVTSEPGFEYDTVSNILTAQFLLTTTVSSLAALNITCIGSATIQPAVNLIIHPAGVTKFQGLADGFLKTSAGDGTVTIDTTTYGNITGSLTSGRVTVGAGASSLQDYANFTYNGTNLAFGSTSAQQEVTQTGNQNFFVGTGSGNTTGLLYLGTNHTARWALDGAGFYFIDQNVSKASGASAVLNVTDWETATVTITGNTNITTAGGFNLMVIRAPTYTSASAVVVTNAATLVIAGAPTTGGSTTITNKYSLWIQGGNARFDGTIGVLSNTVSGFGGGNTLTLQNNDASVATSISLGASTIDVLGSAVPHTNDTYNLGDSSHCWFTLWIHSMARTGVAATMDFNVGQGIDIESNTTGSVIIGHQNVTQFISDINGVAFFGAAVGVAQQTGGAATAGAVYTATEQGMLNRAYQALRAYGLLT